MTFIKWVFYLILFVLLVGVLHYNLPQRDIVRVVNTYEERQEFGGWNDIFWSSGDAGAGAVTTNRDVLFIQTIKANGDTMVYRNEDTSWGWPPYFKFDTADLQTEAADAISPKDAPEWYAMRHYGWRNAFFTIFPNALSLKPVASPDVFLIPWFNIVFLTILFLIFWFIYRRVQMFRRRRIDPVIDGIEDAYDDGRGAVSRWLGTWRRKPR